MGKIFSFLANNKYHKIIMSVTIGIILLYVLLLIIFAEKNVLFKTPNTDTYWFHDSWTVVNEEEIFISEDLPFLLENKSAVNYSKNLGKLNIGDEKLALRVKSDDFTISIADEEIYSYKNPNDTFFKKNTVNGWHMIDLKPEFSSKKITVRFTNSGHKIDSEVGIYDAYIGNNNEIYHSILLDNNRLILNVILTFIITFILYFINFIFLVIRRKKTSSIFYFGLFTNSILTWLISNNGIILTFFVDNILVAENIIYTGVFTMFISYLLLMRELFPGKYKKLFTILLNITAFLLILASLLIIFGFTSYFKIEVPLYIGSIIILLISIACLIDFFKKSDIELKTYYFVLLFISIAGIGIEIFHMFLFKSLQILFLPYIFVLWGIILVVTEIQEVFKEIAHREKLSYYKKISMIDNLTGINNRNAFNFYIEDYIHGEESQKFDFNVAISMDLNDLKTINDKFGHDVGDNAIKTTANAIMATFNDEEFFLCRMGGDEFLILGNTRNKNLIESKIEELKNRISEFNKEKVYELSIALGYAFVESDNEGVDRLFNAIEKSDNRMYENKRQMKALNKGSHSASTKIEKM